MLANISSLATLILFVIYFIGKVMTIIVEKNTRFESIDVYYNENKVSTKYKIVEEYTCCDDYREIIIITPKTKSYNWIAVYECDTNEVTGEITKKEVFKTGRIYNDNSFRINTIIPEIAPRYALEFERSDYMKGELYIACNGKNGVQEEQLLFDHTSKSILYYLFK